MPGVDVETAPVDEIGAGSGCVALALAFFGAFVWVLVSLDILAWNQTTIMAYVALVLIATVMAVGLSWSHIRRRLSGQADIDDVDE